MGPRLMSSEKEVIFRLVEQLNKGLVDGTLTTEQEEKLRDDIGDLLINVIVGQLFDDLG
jgi:hypothetical protein